MNDAKVWVYGPMSFRRAVAAVRRVGYALWEFDSTDSYDEQVWPR